MIGQIQRGPRLPGVCPEDVFIFDNLAIVVDDERRLRAIVVYVGGGVISTLDPDRRAQRNEQLKGYRSRQRALREGIDPAT